MSVAPDPSITARSTGEVALANTAAAAPPRSLGLPRSIGGFQIRRELGRGGMGVVYEAFDDRLARRVAIKTIDLHRVGDRGRDRARREARALACLSHPNVVQVFEVGDGWLQGPDMAPILFLVMEHVEGLTLRQWHQARSRTWREVLEVYRQVAAGLIAAHDKGLVHRDFKPDNAIIGTDGRVRVLDFGLACAQRDPTSRCVGSSAFEGSHSITEDGVVMGTPAYMAPEQFLGKPLDARTDQFALCVSLFEALYGQRPFEGPTRLALLDAITDGRVSAPPRDRGVPRWVLAALWRGLKVDPADRFPDLRALLAALEPPRATRRWVALGLMAAVVGTGAWTMAPSDQGCLEAAAQKWQEVWSPAQRDAVRDALARVSVPYAQHSSARAIEILDDYGAGWVEEHAAACTAATASGPSPSLAPSLAPSLSPSEPRMACLDAGRRRFGALVDALGQADVTVAEHAVQAASELPPMARCADEPRGSDPPSDPQKARNADAVRTDLDRIITRYHTGQHAAAHELAVQVDRRAESLDDRLLHAEVGFWLGHTQDAMGEHEAAAQTLRRAFFEARAAQGDPLAARIATRLVFAEGYRLDHHEAADTWARHARAGLEQIGGDPLLEPRLHMATAHVETARGRYETARAGYEHAREGFVAQHGSHDPVVATALSNLAIAEQMLGSYEAALTHSLQALEIQQALLGPAHPEIARVRSNLGAIHMSSGQLDDALAQFEASLAIAEGQFEPHHRSVLTARSNIAAVYWQKGDFSRALEQQRQIVELLLRGRGDDDPEVASALSNMAGSLLQLGRRADARSTLLRALAIYEHQLPADHPQVGRTLHNLAIIETELDEDAALRHGQRALEIRQQRLPPLHYDLSASHSVLASILESRGELRAAHEAAVKAMQIRELGTIPSVGFLASAHMKVARLSWEIGDDRAAAVALARQAHEEFTAAGERWESEREEAAAWVEQHAPPS
ncbi:MAG: serine/threonine-protein kinase [Myxococcota bacterium]